MGVSVSGGFNQFQGDFFFFLLAMNGLGWLLK